ncbi:hypothetical protein [Acidipropionibacterium timonense]|uniref:hypothetical protein n=1 Tax=Acidipropionibacterium timonense TaxID=2161818 RepID=UPI001436BB7E|nr:hypothetical protein [Acidipropionibacterium timonense]
MDTLHVKILETGRIAELSRSAANEMIAGGFAVQVDAPDPDPDDHEPARAELDGADEP